MRRRSALVMIVTSLGIVGTPTLAAAQSFSLVSPNPFDPQDCNDAGCWTNYNLVVDFDGDGDLDVLLPNSAGFFSKGSPQPFSVYTNDGTGAMTKAAGLFGGSGYLRQVATADIDGDGDVDLYAPSGFGDDTMYPDRLYVQGAPGAYTEEAATRLPGVQVRAGFVRFGDVDSDGDADIVVGDDWDGPTQIVAHLYLNDGSGNFTDASAANLPSGVPGGGTEPIDVELFDADGDFDLDLLINMHSGKNIFWKNDGGGKFTDATGTFPGPGSGSQFHYGPVACDVDGDGDLDVWGDNTGGNYTEQLLINDGSGNFTDETAQRVTGNPGADDNGVVCVDFDGDGDLDAAIMSLSNNERILLNDGTGHFALQAGAFTAAGDPTLWMDFGDLNGDDKLDVVTAQGECGNGTGCRDKVYFGGGSVPADTVAPKFRGVESIMVPGDNEAPVLRFAVVDNTTTDIGPRLQRAFVRVTTSMTEEIDARFMGGDLFRAALPGFASGTMVTLEPCAVDLAGNEGCATPLSYTVGGGSVTSTGVGGSGGMGGGGVGGSAQGGAGPGGSGQGSGGETTSGPGAGGSSATGGGSSGGGDGDDGGCGCHVPGGPARSGLLAAAVLALGALVRRRRR
jgi:MYXO-CTERM domain-containing protein